MLWPRQEILALTVPQLGTAGCKFISNSAVLNVIRQCSKLQSSEGKITFDRWLVVARELLKWNDSCVQLFWDMLMLAIWYSDGSAPSQSNKKQIDVSHLAIFLILHVGDNQPRPSSPAAAYNTIWPSNTEVDSSPLSQQSPMSPIKVSGTSSMISGPLIRASGGTGGSIALVERDRDVNRVSSPRSPRSPKSGALATLSLSPPATRSSHSLHSISPRHHNKMTSATQSLHIIRQKLPVILRALALATEDESTLPPAISSSLDTHDNHTFTHLTPFEVTRPPLSTSGIEFFLSRQAIDSLGLILAGGASHDQQILKLSLLHPEWREDLTLSVPYSELLQWLDGNLCVNELIYPPSLVMSPSQSRRSMSGLVVDELSGCSFAAANEYRDKDRVERERDALGLTNMNSLGPQRVFSTLSSLSRSQPVTLHSSTATYMHIVTIGPHREHRQQAHLQQPSLTSESAAAAKNALACGADSLLTDLRLRDDDYEAKSPSSPSSAVNNASDQNEKNRQTRREEQVNLGAEGWPSSSSSSGLTRVKQDDYERAPSGLTQSDEVIIADEEGQGHHGNIWEPNGAESKQQTVGQPEQYGEDSGAASLPPLVLTSCHRAPMYLLGPYCTAYINACNDCDIVIGAVAGVVVLNGCERVRLSVSCRKLLVHNCLECELNVATLSVSVVSGDTRSVVFGPLNVSYRHLALHLRIAGLMGLVVPSEALNTSNHSVSLAADGTATVAATTSCENCWAQLCDVNACLESSAPSSGAASPSGYALDAAERVQCGPLPHPPASTATVMPVQKFKFISIPLRSEHQPPELSPIPLPAAYREALMARGEQVSQLATRISDLTEESKGKTSSDRAEEEVGGLGDDPNDRLVLRDALALRKMVTPLSLPLVTPSSPSPSTSSSISISTSGGGGGGALSKTLTSDGLRVSTERDSRECMLGAVREISSSAPQSHVTAKFMDWLLSTGRAHHLVDLVRLDVEKASSNRRSSEVLDSSQSKSPTAFSKSSGSRLT